MERTDEHVAIHSGFYTRNWLFELHIGDFTWTTLYEQIKRPCCKMFTIPSFSLTTVGHLAAYCGAILNKIGIEYINL